MFILILSKFRDLLKWRHRSQASPNSILYHLKVNCKMSNISFLFIFQNKLKDRWLLKLQKTSLRFKNGFFFENLFFCRTNEISKNQSWVTWNGTCITCCKWLYILYLKKILDACRKILNLGNVSTLSSFSVMKFISNWPIKKETQKTLKI